MTLSLKKKMVQKNYSDTERITCQKCGELVRREGRYCPFCGTEFVKESIDLPRIYGEVLGKDHVMIFSKLNYSLKYWENKNKRCLRYGYYDHMFYYVKRADGEDVYLWKSKEDGSEEQIIAKFSGEDIPKSRSDIFVNSYGIFLVNNTEKSWRIWWLDFEGKEKNRIALRKEVKNYYICDKKLYLITYENKKETYKVLWMDLEKNEEHVIYTGEIKSRRKNRDGSENCIYSMVDPVIFANRERAIIHIGFGYFWYPGDGNYENCIELNDSSWYSYEFSEEKWYCIEKEDFLPHNIYKDYKRFLDTDINIREKRLAIRNFDIERNIMWVAREDKEDRRYEIWEPHKLEIKGKQSRIEKMASWRVRKEILESAVFFNGDVCYFSDVYYHFYAMNRNGEMKEWTQDGHGSCQDFCVAGNYIFLSKCYEEQYNITFDASEPLRSSWMVFLDGYRKDKDEKNEIAEYAKTKNTVTYGEPTKLEYWNKFINYAFDPVHNCKFTTEFRKSEPADRNWYALRLGTSKGHIEFSINSREQTIKTAFIIKNNPDLYEELKTSGYLFSDTFDKVSGELQWDGISKAKSVSIVRSKKGLSIEEQAEWFMECACIFKTFAVTLFKL